MAGRGSRIIAAMARIATVAGVDADLAYAAGQCVVETHRRLSAWLEPGQTLAQVDQFIARTLDELKCKSCFLGYKVPRTPAFPSHACLSINECVVHGTSSYELRPIEPGDVLKIDIGVKHRGWIGDAAWTYLFGTPTDEVARLADSGKEGIARAIKTMRPGRPLMDWARTLQSYVEEECGFHMVRGLGGHGYGKTLHAPPYVSNVVPSFPGEWPEGSLTWEPGMLVAVEPMIAVGTGQIRHPKGTWPIFTADGSMSVHYEHDVLITDGDPRILTEGLESIKDIIE